MGRKKRQEDHVSSKKPEDEGGLKLCTHTVSINLVRLKPRHNPKLQQKRLGILDQSAKDDKEPLWICLKCAQSDCGRKQHTENKPAGHVISFNLQTKIAWCNVCSINVENQKVTKAFEYLEQHLDYCSENKSPKNEERSVYKQPGKEGEKKKNLKRIDKYSEQLPRGLKNLGNTCFFNVVLQCLAKTPNLISQMQKLKKDKIMTLKTNILSSDFEERSNINLEMDKCMDFSDHLLESLEELNRPENEPYDPNELLNELYTVSSTITMDEQHDAHELLREVLQKIREVNPQRLSASLKSLKSPNLVNEERLKTSIDHITKIYENHTTKEIFEGSLVNIIICQECGSTSYSNEAFLDLSLPITDKKITSSEMNVYTNPRKKPGSGQQKQEQSATMNKHSSRKNEETGLSPKMKIKKGKHQSFIRPVQKNPEHDASRFTLARCLENFTAKEIINDCDKLACSNCTEKNGKGNTVFTSCTKQMQIRTLPAVLVLHLKRFNVKVNGASKTKSTKPKKLIHHIQFPVVLDMSSYIYDENKEEVNLNPREKKSLYSLYAVIEHVGTINQGHYVVYIKTKATKSDASHLKDVNQNDYVEDAEMLLPAKWFHISDESVLKADTKEVQNSQAYILFYEKC